MDPDEPRKLHEQDWNEIGRRLLVHAHRRCGIYAWRTGARNVVIRLGQSPEDVVQEVVRKVLGEQRTWDPRKGELIPTLKRMIDSELSHLWDKQAGHTERPLPDDPAQREVLEAVAPAAILPGPPGTGFAMPVPANPEAQLEQREEVVACSARVTALFAAVEGKPDLQEIIDAVMDGCGTEPRHLAAHLNVSVKEIHNRLRRLRRRATE